MQPTRSDYITGVVVLDDQHEQLFQLVHQAKTLFKDENMLYKFDELQKILKGLRAYTLSHFSTEEAYMEEASYSQLEAHRQLHQSFIEKLNQVDEAVAKGAATFGLVKAIQAKVEEKKNEILEKKEAEGGMPASEEDKKNAQEQAIKDVADDIAAKANSPKVRKGPRLPRR